MFKFDVEVQLMHADEHLNSVFAPLYRIKVQANPKATGTALKHEMDEIPDVVNAQRNVVYLRSLKQGCEEILKGMAERAKMIDALLYQDGNVTRAAGMHARQERIK
jgi:hypothetical protein